MLQVELYYHLNCETPVNRNILSVHEKRGHIIEHRKVPKNHACIMWNDWSKVSDLFHQQLREGAAGFPLQAYIRGGEGCGVISFEAWPHRVEKRINVGRFDGPKLIRDRTPKSTCKLSFHAQSQRSHSCHLPRSRIFTIIWSWSSSPKQAPIFNVRNFFCGEGILLWI